MPDRAPYQYLPTLVLEDQQRADAAAAWGDRQRADIARRWADMHLQDARDSLGPLLNDNSTQTSQGAPGGLGVDATAAMASPVPPTPPAPTEAPFTPAGGDSYLPPPDTAAAPVAPDGVATSGDRPPSELDTVPALGRSVGGSFAPSQAVGGSFGEAQDAAIERRPLSPAAAPIAGALLRGVPGGEFLDPNAVVGAGHAAGQVLLDQTEEQRRNEATLAGGSLADIGDPRRVDAAVAIAGTLAGEPLANAGGSAARAAAREVGRLRLDKFPEAVRSTIEQAATRGDYWLQQRRNVIPDAEAEKMADELGRSVEELVAGGKAGRAYNTEETRALRNALTGQALKVDDLRATVEALGEWASDAIQRVLGLEESRLLALSRVAEGARAEAGRAFRAYLADTRGRLARASGPQYTSTSRVPTASIEDMAAPGAGTPQVTTQLPLLTEPVAGKGREGFKERVYDRASLTRLAGMVSAVPTHLLNIAGNTVMGGTSLLMKEGQVGADLARVGVGRLLGRDVQRQRFQAEVGPQMAGYARGFWAGVQQVPGILAHGLPDDFKRVYDARGLDSGSTVLDTAVEAPLRALAASDAVFRGAAFGGHAAALATRQATQEGLSGAARSQRVQEILGNLSDYPGLLESANRLAARDVFQESRGLTDAISKAKREHTGAQVAGDVFLPFYKTPYNVAAQGAGMTPAGYASVIEAAKRGETGEAVDRAVRATVGTVAMLGGLQLAQSNLLTGAYPENAGERSTLPEGWKPYSLRVPSGDGAVYVPIQSLGAWAVPLGAAAVVQDARRRGVAKDDLLKGTIYPALGGIGQFMGDMSALQGLNAVFKLATAPERSVESFSENLGASFVPVSGLARQVQQALGDAQRDPDNPVQAFMAGVPGLSQFVPTKQTPLGQDRERGPAGPTALVTGSRIGVERPSSVTAALRDAGVGIPEPPKTVSTESVKNVPLTEAEQRAYRRYAGEEIARRVQGYTNHQAWASADAATRAKKLRGAVEDARQAAEKRVLTEMGVDEARRRVRRPAA